MPSSRHPSLGLPVVSPSDLPPRSLCVGAGALRGQLTQARPTDGADDPK
ncbi:hypothetical protein IEQ44_03590 [Nocardioides sp. Y6]|uniref:Uncharacterized protein n=1 Tax=Nocardioides malaquae TaxID=2773426 RepID=A0ABR9RRC1_9ACTN|nr:hypothetical protein [Nocardioides malaquae]MBE7323732.1 hypothetical protein [Nocardioides malaquae]